MRLEISAKSILILAALLIVLWLMTQVWSVLLLVAVSIMLAAALFPAVEWMVRHGVRRGLAVAVVSILLLATMALIGFVLVPTVVNQSQAILDHLPDIRADAANFLRRHHEGKLANKVGNLDVGTLIETQSLVSTGRYLIGVLYSTITVLVLTVYFLLDARRAERFIFYLTPRNYHGHLSQLLYELRRTVGGYVRGQLISSALILIYTLIVLEAVGVPNAAALAVLAGIADMIPVVGGIFAIAPQAITALSVSFTSAIIVSILLVAYSQFESRVLVPRVFGGALRLPAVVVFVALLMGAEVAGLAGALLAVPIAAVIRGMIEYAHDVRSGRITPVVSEEDAEIESEALAMDEMPKTPPTTEREQQPERQTGSANAQTSNGKPAAPANGAAEPVGEADAEQSPSSRTIRRVRRFGWRPSQTSSRNR